MRSTWIVVADSSRARILRSTTAKGKLVEIMALDHPQSRAKARDLVEDGLSTTFASVGNARHGVGPNDPPQMHEHEVFARNIAQTLERARVENKFDKLVLMAPPQFLGTLRNVMSPPMTKLIVQTVDKDLTRLPLEHVHAQLEPLSLSAL